jgi:hypothetical protein
MSAGRLSDAERAKLLAQAEKLNKASLDDFSSDAMRLYDGRNADLFKYSGDDAMLRKRLLDAGFASVVQRGARSRPGIIRIYPDGDAPTYVPRERMARPARTVPVVDVALNPKDVMRLAEYIGRKRETWRVEARKSAEQESGEVAAAVNKIGYETVRDYINRIEEITGSEGWRRHLIDTFGLRLVEFFGPEIDGGDASAG